MTPRPEVVVVGGGIAGLCTALSLATRGLRVTVIDEHRLGAASRASAGMLAPGIGFEPAVRALAVAARDAYPAFLAGLLATTGIDVGLDRRGVIELGTDEADVVRLHAHADDHAVRLDARALAERDPLLAGHPGGLLHPDDGAVDNVRLMDALEAAAARHGRITFVRAAVTSLRPTDGGVAATTRDGSTHAAPCVVLAAGAWGGELAGLPRGVPVRPLPGELMLLDHPGPRHVVHGAGGYLIPRRGKVLVGATNGDAGLATTTTDAGLASLLAFARRTVPALEHATVSDHWAGLRPMSPDGLPILGVDPDLPALVHAGGLSRNGILFAPWAAGQLAREVCGERSAVIDRFRIERFTRREQVEGSA